MIRDKFKRNDYNKCRSTQWQDNWPFIKVVMNLKGDTDSNRIKRGASTPYFLWKDNQQRNNKVNLCY